MAATNVSGIGITQSKGIDYTWTTDVIGDATSVPISTYFYNFGDGLPYYKDGTGTVLSLFSAGGGADGNGIYSGSGNLTSGQTVVDFSTNGASELLFDEGVLKVKQTGGAAGLTLYRNQDLGFSPILNFSSNNSLSVETISGAIYSYNRTDTQGSFHLNNREGDVFGLNGAFFTRREGKTLISEVAHSLNTTPNSALVVHSSGTGNENTFLLYGDDGSRFNHWFQSNGNIRFCYTGGNVGIGITSVPTVKLHVGGNTQIDGNLDLNGQLYADSSALNTPHFFQTSNHINGQVLAGWIGATSNSKGFHLGGAKGDSPYNNLTSYASVSSATTDDFHLRANNVVISSSLTPTGLADAKLTVDGDFRTTTGNVGIRGAVDGTKVLRVYGDTQIDGDLTVDTYTRINGNGSSLGATFSRVGRDNGTDYALNAFFAGNTSVNAITGQNVSLRINNVARLVQSDTLLTVSTASILNGGVTVDTYGAMGRTGGTGLDFTLGRVDSINSTDYGINFTFNRDTFINASTGRVVGFFENGVQHSRVQNNGEWGLGTTTPVAGKALTVGGDTQIDGVTTIDSVAEIRDLLSGASFGYTGLQTATGFGFYQNSLGDTLINGETAKTIRMSIGGTSNYRMRIETNGVVLGSNTTLPALRTVLLDGDTQVNGDLYAGATQGFTGTVANPTSITVVGGIVTAVS